MKKTDLRKALLAIKPKLTPVTIGEQTYYLREPTVGDMNRQIFETRYWLIEQAKNEGVALPDDENSAEFEQALDAFGIKYRLARTLALRLCDEKGELLFNPNDVNDLNALAGLDGQVLGQIYQAGGDGQSVGKGES